MTGKYVLEQEAEQKVGVSPTKPEGPEARREQKQALKQEAPKEASKEDALPPLPEPEQEEKTPPGFRDNSEYVRGIWNNINEDFEKDLKKSRLSRTASGLLMEFADGHRIVVQEIRGHEFIGVHLAKDQKFDAADARHIVSASKSHGWNKIDLHGTEAQKELLWLEAKKAGLEVSNFQPDPNSAVAAAWDDFKKKEPKKEADGPGVTPTVESKFEKFLTEKIEKAPSAEQAEGLKAIQKFVSEGQAKLNAEDQSKFIQKLDGTIPHYDGQKNKVEPYQAATKFFTMKTGLEVPPAAAIEKVAAEEKKQEAPKVQHQTLKV